MMTLIEIVHLSYNDQIRKSTQNTQMYNDSNRKSTQSTPKV